MIFTDDRHHIWRISTWLTEEKVVTGEMSQVITLHFFDYLNFFGIYHKITFMTIYVHGNYGQRGHHGHHGHQVISITHQSHIITLTQWVSQSQTSLLERLVTQKIGKIGGNWENGKWWNGGGRELTISVWWKVLWWMGRMPLLFKYAMYVWETVQIFQTCNVYMLWKWVKYVYCKTSMHRSKKY